MEYDAAFLRSAYQYPGTRMELSPAFFEDRRMIAFVSAFPRTVRLHSDALRLALLTFFTVAPENKGRGLGKALWAECLRRVKESGYDGALHYCVDGNQSNHVTVAAARSIGLETSRVFTVKYMIRALAQPPATTVGDDSKGDDPNQFQSFFARLASALQIRVPFCRIWTPEEISWECARRSGAVCASLEEASGARGLITGYRLRTLDAGRTPVLLLENMLWDDIDLDRRLVLLERLLARVAGTVRAVAAPLWGYTDTSALARSRFRLSTRVLHAYLTLWNGRQMEPVTPMYIDVF